MARPPLVLPDSLVGWRYTWRQGFFDYVIVAELTEKNWCDMRGTSVASFQDIARAALSNDPVNPRAWINHSKRGGTGWDMDSNIRARLHKLSAEGCEVHPLGVQPVIEPVTEPVIAVPPPLTVIPFSAPVGYYDEPDRSMVERIKAQMGATLLFRRR